MTGARTPDVTVRVLPGTTHTRVSFEARDPRVPAFRADLPANALPGIRAELDRHLLQLKDTLTSLSSDDSDLGRVSAALHRIGTRTLFALLGLQPSVINGLVDFWNRALPSGRDPGRMPFVECVGDRDGMLPLEFLPLYGVHSGDEVTTRDEFVRACRDLVGFSCQVRRSVLPAPLRGGLRLHTGGSGRLPLRFLQHEGLRGARRELDWLTGAAADRVEVVGPYPNGDDGAPALSRQVFDPRLRLDGGRGDRPDQVQHFACHCYTGAGSPFEHEIELCGGGHRVRVTLGSLADDLMKFTARRGGGGTDPAAFADRPLVVMNACGSARMAATGSVSFPYLFLQNGSRGFVGSEIEIPDEVAAEFSEVFYRNFLLYGCRLGEALLRARNHLLYEFRNPLGLAYCAYADPDLRVHRCSEEGTCAG